MHYFLHARVCVWRWFRRWYTVCPNSFTLVVSAHTGNQYVCKNWRLRDAHTCIQIAIKTLFASNGFWNWLQPEYNMSITTTATAASIHYIRYSGGREKRSEKMKSTQKKNCDAVNSSVRCSMMTMAYEELHTQHTWRLHRHCCRVYWFSDGLQLQLAGPLCRSIRISRARTVHAEHSSRNKYTLAIHAKFTFHNTNRDLIGFWRVPRAHIHQEWKKRT